MFYYYLFWYTQAYFPKYMVTWLYVFENKVGGFFCHICTNMYCVYWFFPFLPGYGIRQLITPTHDFTSHSKFQVLHCLTVWIFRLFFWLKNVIETLSNRCVFIWYFIYSLLLNNIMFFALRMYPFFLDEGSSGIFMIVFWIIKSPKWIIPWLV